MLPIHSVIATVFRPSIVCVCSCGFYNMGGMALIAMPIDTSGSECEALAGGRHLCIDGYSVRLGMLCCVEFAYKHSCVEVGRGETGKSSPHFSRVFVFAC